MIISTVSVCDHAVVQKYVKGDISERQTVSGPQCSDCEGLVSALVLSQKRLSVDICRNIETDGVYKNRKVCNLPGELRHHPHCNDDKANKVG